MFYVVRIWKAFDLEEIKNQKWMDYQYSLTEMSEPASHVDIPKLIEQIYMDLLCGWVEILQELMSFRTWTQNMRQF